MLGFWTSSGQFLRDSPHFRIGAGAGAGAGSRSRDRIRGRSGGPNPGPEPQIRSRIRIGSSKPTPEPKRPLFFERNVGAMIAVSVIEAGAGRGGWQEGSLYPDAVRSPGQAVKRPFSRGRFASRKPTAQIPRFLRFQPEAYSRFWTCSRIFSTAALASTTRSATPISRHFVPRVLTSRCSS